MKKILALIVISLTLVSCWKYDINKENIETTYKVENRSLNLDNKWIENFVNLNEFMIWTEVNNIYLQNNKIQKLNISDFKELWRLDISNNEIRFINDLTLPENIRHLNISNNNLSDIKWLDKYNNIKTLDISNNNIKGTDLNLEIFPKLKYINITWNNMNDDILKKVDTFNSIYLSNNPIPFSN